MDNNKDENNFTVAELIKAAAENLRGEFETIRKTLPHYGEQGEEIEEIVKKFLNNYLPKRFKAGSGFILDKNNNRSKQCDVIIYDQILSPIIRASSKSLILPNEYVASVIEVKSNLNKSQLEDALNKIHIAKALKKDEPTEHDLPSTGSPIKVYRTLGIVFAFNSETSLETLAKNIVEFNNSIDSNHWIDFLIVLDKGIIEFQAQKFRGGFIGSQMPPTSEKAMIPPCYIHLTVKELGKYSLNWFWGFLNLHLTFYIHRPNYMNINTLMKGATNEAMTIQSYQMGLDRKLHKPPADEYENEYRGPLAKIEVSGGGIKFGDFFYYKWLDGCFLEWHESNPFPLNDFLLNFVKAPLNKTMLFSENPTILATTILNISLEEFCKWPDKIVSNLQLNLILYTK